MYALINHSRTFNLELLHEHKGASRDLLLNKVFSPLQPTSKLDASQS